MHQFFVPHIDNNDLITLPESEAKHFSVLRLTEKDNIVITDGHGTRCKVKVKEISKKKIILEILKRENFSHPAEKMIIAIAPTKGNERFEWFLEKAVELGISGIIPFHSEFSERKKINPVRIQKIMVAALKQSMGVFLPTVENISGFEKILELAKDKSAHCFIAHCKKKDLPLLKEKILSFQKIIIMIGPEGGFTNKEINMAKYAGWQEVSLGENRLRTETAGIVAALTVEIVHL